MKELEVKEMLADERIPEEYKRGGRLSSEFLDGVDFAEQRIMEKGVEMWVARDPDGSIRGYFEKPFFSEADGGVWERWVDCGYDLQLKYSDFSEVTFENSPVKARIILED